MKKLVYALGLLVAITAISQDKVARKFARTITTTDLKSHLTVLASDEYEGRETGKKGQKMAARYIANHFKGLGFEPPVKGGYFQKFDLSENAINAIYFRKGEEKKENLKDFIYYSKVETMGEEYISLIVADEKDSGIDEYKGKYVVYLLESFEMLSERYEKAKKAGAIGAIYALKNEKEFGAMIGRFGRYFAQPQLSLRKSKSSGDRMLIVDTKLVSWIYGKPFDKLQSGDETKIIFNADYLIKPVPTENVLGFLRGKEKPNEVLVVTSHYDHIGVIDGEINNGADDDGSGTVTVLEIAEAFSQATRRGYRPKRSILFMTVTGEEKGLLGSSYYTDFDPIFPLENTVANLNIDMVGRVDDRYKKNPNYIYLIGSDKLSQELHNLSENVNKKTEKLKLDYTYNDENDPNRFYYRSDHYNFAKNNIPIIFYFNGTHPDYHKPTDTVEKINFDKMSKIAKLVFYTAWEIANREKRIKVDPEKMTKQ